MLIFESTKTNTPIPQQDLAPILTSPPHAYVDNPGITTITETSEDVWNEAKSTLLTYQERNNATSTSNSRHSRSLSFSPLLESCSDIYTGLTSCLIVTLLFNVLFLWYFPFVICHLSLSIVDLLISVLCTQIERSRVQDTPPYCWLDISGFWDWSKAFFKIA